MAEFAWEARARTGEVRKGVMDAENEAAVQTRLRGLQLNPTKITQKRKSLDLKNVTLGSGVSSQDLVKFTRQFATMIDAGLPLVQCLDILANQEPNPRFQIALRDIKNSVEQGATFSDSLRRHPKIFDELFVNLVQAGEVGGILDTIMNRLAGYIEKRAKLARQVRGAMAYPVAVIIIMIVVIVVLMTFVIPAFEGMFAEFGAKDALPGLTKAVIATSRAFVSALPFTIVGSIGLVFGSIQFYKNPKGKRMVHRLLLKLPIFGPVMQKIAVARFTRTLGTLLGSGVPILDALDIVAKTAGNVIIEEGLVYARAKISEGRNMAEPLEEIKVFPGMVVQMVAVGEQTGALDTMLNKIADFYEEEVDVAVSALTSLLEPLLMVIVGVVVGVVLISMYLPIFSLAGNIKGE
ncbi:type II secretion system F family protein [Polyangium jinanense]|uniref:Type II secretion system F family protein n=1 Tax=Polyangium jinanense TaxID=2829994 RepID=A0A9X4ARN1_9BACT|nr:type II secretion system F family protein [Polyangium jinanense]MDC3955626.1 type II secretion system F family protein [Polyangium jinanense]MDC3982268.1 type II secretion system F family protein [Polyangium jinanense]